MKQYFSHPERPPAPGKIASAIRCGQWIYVSGQGPLDLSPSAPALYTPASIEEETALTLHYIERLVVQAGGKKSDIVKCTCYLGDLDDFAGFHKAFQDFFADCKLPTRTTVGAPLLRGIKVEIDAVAFVEE